MNRENKRKKYEKGYYKNHPCNNTFTCKVCGRPVTVFPVFTLMKNPEIEHLTVVELWNLYLFG